MFRLVRVANKNGALMGKFIRSLDGEATSVMIIGSQFSMSLSYLWTSFKKRYRLFLIIFSKIFTKQNHLRNNKVPDGQVIQNTGPKKWQNMGQVYILSSIRKLRLPSGKRHSVIIKYPGSLSYIILSCNMPYCKCKYNLAFFAKFYRDCGSENWEKYYCCA